MEEFVKKVIIPALVTTGLIFTAKNCSNCVDEKGEKRSTEETPVIAKITPIQDETRKELLRTFVVPGECPEGNEPQITCNSKDARPAELFEKALKKADTELLERIKRNPDILMQP